jgi:hypothetical protein
VVENITFVGCSGKVDKALAADIMKSVVYLVPDLLDNLPILLYQGKPLCPKPNNPSYSV